MELLLFCLTVSLACTAIHVAVTWDGMALKFIKRGYWWVWNYIDPCKRTGPISVFIAKPLFDCLICMASFWTVFFWLCYIKPITFELLFAVLITCGINVVIRCIINQMTERNEW